ncbi:hypothetical protein DH2020_016799 [Rehmannia glutinosa]|uniref:Uncharacterized protein n=1 Tax=Rehmannia glutinosa TaxID=99300 RepID=A0ABR0WQ47_REHGL
MGEKQKVEDKLSLTVGDAVDYKGFPADRSKTGGWIPAALILGIEICERLSTMGIAVNLVTYLGGVMHLPSSTSANIVTDFMGTCFLLWYRMLAITTALPRLRPPPCHARHDISCKQADGFQMAILYLALYLIALGTGGLKSSVSGFGTDQFDDKDEKEKAQMAFFFNRFFFFISIGTLAAVTVLVYKKSSGSPIVQIFQVIVAAIRKRNMSLPYDVNMLYEDTPQASRIAHTDQFNFLDKAAIVAEGDFENRSNCYNPWKLCSVTRVEEVKMVGRLLPIWATTIIFWTTYAQMITFSVEQASTMNRSIGNFRIPAGSLTVFFVAAILITLAVYDRLIMPLWNKWKGKPGFSSLQRIAIGLVLSTIGMAVAALAEMKRLSVAKSVGRSNSTNLPITVFILIPQFFLVGSGEAFIYTGQLDFFITQSPKGMKTMSTGLFLTTLSLGFFVSSFLVSVVTKVTTSNGGRGWLADNINYGRLDCFYGLLALLGVINLVIYLICAVWYKPKPAAAHMEPAFNGTTGEDKC